MTLRIEPLPTARVAPADAASTRASTGTPAIAVAPSGPASTSRADDTQSAQQRRASAAVQSALLGNPEALVALVAMSVRQSSQREMTTDVRTADAQARMSQREHDDQVKAALDAAKQALEASKSGDLFGIIAKIVTVVVATVATFVTCGAAAPFAAGALLVAFADDIASGLVKAGVLTPEQGGWVADSIRLAGAVLMAPATGGLSLVAFTAEECAERLVPMLEDMGLSADVITGITVGLQVASAIASIAGGSGSAGAVADTVNAVGEAANGAAKVTQGAFEIVRADATHTHDLREADATRSHAGVEAARTQGQEAAGELRSATQQVARMMRLALQTAEARQAAAHAAAGQRG